MDDFDPNVLNDPEGDRRRRRRRARDLQESEFDDAWSAANEDDISDHLLEIEDLASGYVYDETERRYGDDESPNVPDLGPLPPSAQRLSGRRRQPREERIKNRYDPRQAYAESPSYRSKRGIINKVLSGITGEEPVMPSMQPRRNPDFQPGFLSTLPFWAILILVFMGFTIALISVLVCVWTMALLN